MPFFDVLGDILTDTGKSLIDAGLIDFELEGPR